MVATRFINITDNPNTAGTGGPWSGGSIAAGGSGTYSATTPDDGTGVIVWFEFVDGGGNASEVGSVTFTFGAGSGQVGEFNVTSSCTFSNTCLTNVTFSVRNNDTREHSYFVEDSTGQIYPQTTTTVEAGGAKTITVTLPCLTVQAGVGLWMLGEGLTPSSPVTHDPVLGNPTGDSGSHSSENSTNPASISTPSAPTKYDASKPSDILFTATAITNALASQQQGDSALYDAVTKFAKQNHDDSVTIATAWTNGLHITNTNILAGFSNTPAITNYAQENTTVGMSNLLATIASNKPIELSDLTNIEERVNARTNFNWSQTNSAIALATPSRIMGNMTEVALDDSDVGSADLINLTLGASVPLILNTGILDEKFPALSEGKPIFKWAIIMILVICNYKLMIKGLRTTLLIPQATTAGSSIFGTNINAASAVVMAAAIVAIAAALPTIFASGVLDALSHITWGNPISKASQGYAFCEHYFPVALLVTAILNHLGYRVLLDAAENVGLGIVKFLTGL